MRTFTRTVSGVFLKEAGILWIYCMVVIISNFAWAAHSYHPSRTLFLNALLTDYNHEVPPMFDNGEICDVFVSVFVNSFHSFKETDMEFTTDLILQQQWHDKRLQFHGLVPSGYMELDSRLLDRLWVPDLYFVNEKQAAFREIPVSNKMLHLYGNGTVVYKARLRVTASCPMDLKNYPMDRQLCSLLIQSFGFSTHSLILHWDREPLKSRSDMQLPHFKVVHSGSTHCDASSEDGNFTCLQVDFYLQRHLGFYILHLYVPSCLVVVVSWLSFWIQPGAVSGRTSLGILTILTLTTQGSTSTDALPKVSYIKASDIWMAACLFFVFAAFLQYAIVCVTARAHCFQAKGATSSSHRLPSCKKQQVFASNSSRASGSTEKNGSNEVDIGGTAAKRIDMVSRVAFPIVFFAFVVLYFLYFSFWASYVF